MDEYLKVRVSKSQAHFTRVRDPKGPDTGIGEFLLLLEVTATQETVFIPISIASGKKPTGFVYHIEGTGQGDIATTDISCKGAGVTQITSGTIMYAKIPKGVTATFRIQVEIKGRVGKAYTIVLNRIHYKFDAAYPRYERHLKETKSKTLMFR